MDRRAYYRQARQQGLPAQQAWREAGIRVAWDEAEAAGLVRLRVEPDDSWEPDSLDSREREAECLIAEREGVWGLVADARCPCCGSWRSVDSCWAFLGHDSWRGSGYDVELMRAALDELGSE